jgi:hypothetical protein
MSYCIDYVIVDSVCTEVIANTYIHTYTYTHIFHPYTHITPLTHTYTHSGPREAAPGQTQVQDAPAEDEAQGTKEQQTWRLLRPLPPSSEDQLIKTLFI